jgi:hypothetical protein
MFPVLGGPPTSRIVLTSLVTSFPLLLVTATLLPLSEGGNTGTNSALAVEIIGCLTSNGGTAWCPVYVTVTCSSGCSVANEGEFLVATDRAAAVAGGGRHIVVMAAKRQSAKTFFIFCLNLIMKVEEHRVTSYFQM